MATPEIIAVTPEARRALLEAAAAAKRPQIQLASDALLRGLVGGAAQQEAMTPDAAASLLVDCLDPVQAELIRRLCKEEGKRPIQYLLSYASLAYDHGNTAVAIPEDDPRVSGTLAQGAVGRSVLCGWCGKPFTATRAGQKFCPPTVDETVTLSCGKQAAMAQIKAQRPAVASKERAAAMRGTRLADEAG